MALVTFCFGSVFGIVMVRIVVIAILARNLNSLKLC